MKINSLITTSHPKNNEGVRQEDRAPAFLSFIDLKKALERSKLKYVIQLFCNGEIPTTSIKTVQKVYSLNNIEARLNVRHTPKIT